MSKHKEILEEIRELYAPYGDMGIALGELQKVDSLIAKLDTLKDPEWIAFRENPVTLKLFKASVALYRSAHNELANDDGVMTQVDRARLFVAKRWAMWFIKSLGGDPKKIKDEVEREVERFAKAAGIETKEG